MYVNLVDISAEPWRTVDSMDLLHPEFADFAAECTVVTVEVVAANFHV